MRNNKKMKRILKIFISLFAVLAFIALPAFLYFKLGLNNLTEEELHGYIESTGAVAPLVYIFASFLQVTVVPIPGALTILAGEVLFGPWLAYLYSYVGMMAGAMLAFFLGRKIGRPFVDFIAGSKDKANKWICKLRGKENIVLFFMFLLPLFPDDLLCAVAGMLPMTYGGFFFMQLITRATSIGATLFFMSGEIIPFSGWGIPVLLALGALALAAFVLSMKYSDKFIDRKTGNKT